MWPPRETTTKTGRPAPRPDAVDITDKCVKPFTVLSNQYAECPGNTFLFNSVAVAYLSVMRRKMSSSGRKTEDHAAKTVTAFHGMDKEARTFVSARNPCSTTQARNEPVAAVGRDVSTETSGGHNRKFRTHFRTPCSPSAQQSASLQ